MVGARHPGRPERRGRAGPPAANGWSRIGIAILLAAPALLAAVELEALHERPLHTGALAEWVISGGDWPLTTDCRQLPVLEIEHRGAVVRRSGFLYRPYSIVDGTEDGAEYRAAGAAAIHVRHVFRAAGRHELRLVDGERVLLRREVEIERGVGPTGPIGVSPHNPRLLAYADGSPLITIGCNLAWAARPDRLRRMVGYLDNLATAGGNHCRVWMASWSGQIESDRPDRYRLDQAWMIDQILHAAQARGISVTLVLDNHHDLIHGTAFPYGETPGQRVETFFDPELSAPYRRRLHYLAARYAAFDALLAWELFNEIDLAFLDQAYSLRLEEPQQRAAAWTSAAAEALAAADPDRHLITISLAREDWPHLWAVPAIDLVHIHRYVARPDERSELDRDGVGIMIDALTQVRHIGKPFAFDEVGHHGEHGDVPGIGEDPAGHLFQHMTWAGLMLGGHGSGMYWWWDDHIAAHDLWSVYRPLATVCDRIDWTDAKLQPLDPNRGSRLRVMGWRSRDQAVLWPQVRDDTWHALAIDGATPTRFEARRPAIVLPGMAPTTTFSLHAVDIDDGTVAELDRATSDADGRLRIRLPAAAGRKVLVIRR